MIEQTPDLLIQVDGIGEVRVERIKKSWQEQRLRIRPLYGKRGWIRYKAMQRILSGSAFPRHIPGMTENKRQRVGILFLSDNTQPGPAAGAALQNGMELNPGRHYRRSSRAMLSGF